MRPKNLTFVLGQCLKFKSVRRLFLVLIKISLPFLIFTIYVNLVNDDAELNNPVKGAGVKNWDAKSYWHTPWGLSKVHKGVDIFAAHQTPVISPFDGIVISSGYSENGGNFLYVWGPKFRIYYFAHLNSKGKATFSIIKKGAEIGVVGNSGNAISAPYHLHFSIFSIFPVLRNYSSAEPFGWKKMFYLDPNKLLKRTNDTAKS